MQSQPGEPPPVFVDRSGKRRRLTVLAGTSIGVGLMVSLGLIIAGLFAGSDVPLPGWPDPKPSRPAEADLRPSPAVEPSQSGQPDPTRTAGSVTVSRSAAAPTQAAVATKPGATPRRTGKPSRSPGKPG